VATAKGLCYALNVPLISGNTLQLLASQGKDVVTIDSKRFDQTKVLFCPMLDARRMEVYCMLLDFNLQEIEPTQARIIDERSFAEHLEQKAIYFLGEGAQKCIGIFNHPNALFFPHLTPDAKRLGEVGYSKWQHSLFEDVATFEPFYLKDFLIKKPNLV
jgi:tRNA threonylcarbamoyladenosine biosynthesis protein TsaB